MDCSLPGSSVHGIFQARVLERVAISFSRGSSWPMDGTQVSYIVGRHFIIWATREVSKGSRIWEAPGKESEDSSRGSHSEWTDSVSLCRMWEDLVSMVFIISVSVKILRYEFNMLLYYNFLQANIQPKNNIYPSKKIKFRFKMKKKKANCSGNFQYKCIQLFLFLHPRLMP